MVADMVTDMVADMMTDMVADMEVDKVTAMVEEKKNSGRKKKKNQTSRQTNRFEDVRAGTSPENPRYYPIFLNYDHRNNFVLFNNC